MECSVAWGIGDRCDLVGACTRMSVNEAGGGCAAQDGTDALEVIRAAKPDLVILDIMLPGRSGMEILRDLREEEDLKSLPVLMLTARGQAKDREMAEQAGVSRFMTKPFSNTEVVTAVRDLYAQASRG